MNGWNGLGQNWARVFDDNDYVVDDDNNDWRWSCLGYNSMPGASSSSNSLMELSLLESSPPPL